MPIIASRLGSRSRLWALALVSGIAVIFVLFGAYSLWRGYLYGLVFFAAGVAIGAAAACLPGGR